MYFQIFNRWRFLDNLTTLLTMIGLVISMACYELVLLKYEPKDLDFNNRTRKIIGEDAQDTVRFKDPLNIQLRWIVLILSIGSCVTMIMRHYFKYLWLKRYFNKNRGTQEDLF